MRAILLLHGFATDGSDFARITPILTSLYDEVCCPNLPGHGPHAEKEKIYFEQILSFTVAEFDRLQGEYGTVDVAGFSMGGALATMLASVRKVGRLILLAPANRYIAPFFLVNTLKRLGDVEYHRLQENRALEGKKAHPKDIDKGVISSKEIVGDFSDAVKMFFDRLLPKSTVRNVREFSKVIKSCNSSLKMLDCPVLILWGKLDQLVPFASIRHILGYCKKGCARLIVYPDLSHLMLHSRGYFRITDDIFKFISDTTPPLIEGSRDKAEEIV